MTGRLTEALGGIRIVKSYTAEKREEIVFTHGAHRLFRNIAQSMTGVSATTSGSTVIIGVVGVVMIWMGGNDIVAGRMTLGDFVMYIFFIGLLAAPMISIASIGTQITEAFAGLDRIREIMNMQTEDEADAGKPSLGEIRGDIKFEDVWFEYNEGVPVLKNVTLPRRAGHDDGAGGIERLGQEHADQPGDGVQPAEQGPHPRRRQGPERHPAARLPRAAGVGAAGELPVRRHHRRQHRLREAGVVARRDQARRRRSRTARSSSSSSPRATTRSSASAASS